MARLSFGKRPEGDHVASGAGSVLVAGEPSTGGRDRRTVLVAGALLGVVALAGAGYLVLGGGGDGDIASPVPATATRARSTAPTPAPEVVVPAAAQLPQGRNPFKVLYTAPASAAPVVPTTGATGGTGTAPVGTPTVAPTTPTGTGGPGSTTTYKLTLDAFGQLLGDARSMAWTVDGLKKSVLVGQRFGRTGELVVLTVKTVKGAQQAVLQIGDAAPRSVGVGATIDVM